MTGETQPNLSAGMGVLLFARGAVCYRKRLTRPTTGRAERRPPCDRPTHGVRLRRGSDAGRVTRAPIPRRCAMEASTTQPDAPVLNIVGDKVALGPMRRDLMPLYDRWFNDIEAGLPYFLQLRPHTREAREAWYERLAKDDPSVVDFLIYERATMRPIGKCNLDQIDLFNRTAEFGIRVPAC